jgi:hypothetical protein
MREKEAETYITANRINAEVWFFNFGVRDMTISHFDQE